LSIGRRLAFFGLSGGSAARLLRQISDTNNHRIVDIDLAGSINRNWVG
jgi:hypothetical protein